MERDCVVVERSGIRDEASIGHRSTEHILHRQGIGKLKHIDVTYLWMQDEVESAESAAAVSR